MLGIKPLSLCLAGTQTVRNSAQMVMPKQSCLLFSSSSLSFPFPLLFPQLSLAFLLLSLPFPCYFSPAPGGFSLSFSLSLPLSVSFITSLTNQQEMNLITPISIHTMNQFREAMAIMITTTPRDQQRNRFWPEMTVKTQQWDKTQSAKTQQEGGHHQKCLHNPPSHPIQA